MVVRPASYASKAWESSFYVQCSLPSAYASFLSLGGLDFSPGDPEKMAALSAGFTVRDVEKVFEGLPARGGVKDVLRGIAKTAATGFAGLTTVKPGPVFFGGYSDLKERIRREVVRPFLQQVRARPPTRARDTL